MKKRLLALLLIISMLSLSLMACGKKDSNNETVPETPSATEAESVDETESAEAEITGCDFNIASLKGPTSIGLVKLFSDSDEGKTINKYNYSIHGTADEISTGIVKGEIDVAAVPCNLASVLYNKTEGQVVIAAVNTLGVLYILQKGENIESVADLKGKTIYTTGQGTTPEYTLRYLLSSNDINPDSDVTIEFLSEASEVVAKIAEMESAVVMLPQPYVTIAMGNDENLKVALDVTEEWEKLDENSTVVTGVVIARKAFIDEHPEQFDAFLTEYKASAEYANSNTDECADLVEKFDIFKAAVAKKAIPECNVTFMTGEEMETKVLSYLTVLFNQNPVAVGGSQPDENIFY